MKTAFSNGESSQFQLKNSGEYCSWTCDPNEQSNDVDFQACVSDFYMCQREMTCKETFIPETHDISTYQPWFTPEGDVCNLNIVAYDDKNNDLVHITKNLGPSSYNCEKGVKRWINGRLIKLEIDHSQRSIHGIRLTTDVCHCDQLLV